MEMAYGFDVKSNEDRFLRATVAAIKSTTRVMVPGAFLVDTIPMRALTSELANLPLTTVKYVPEWFPGAGLKTFARTARKKYDVAVDGPLEYVKESMKVSLPGTSAYLCWC